MRRQQGREDGAALCSEAPAGSEQEIGGEGENHARLPLELWSSFRFCVPTSPMGDGGQGFIPKTWTALIPADFLGLLLK